MWFQVAALVFLVSEFLYHAIVNDSAVPDAEVQTPLTAENSPIPLLYGRCRVQKPINAYTSTPITRPLPTTSGGVPGNQYMVDMHFVLGIGMQGGTNKIYNAYAGDLQLTQFNYALADLDGNGNWEANEPGGGERHADADVAQPTGVPTPPFDTSQNTGSIEFLNGNPAQQLVDPSTGAPTTVAGWYMQTTDWLNSLTPDPDQPWDYGVGHTKPLTIPGYRGYLSVFLYSTVGLNHWAVGYQPQIAAYSFEVGSVVPSSIFGPAFDPIGDDCNPVAVIYDLLTDPRKLGYDAALIDFDSFQTAASTLRSERHGFSRCFDSEQTFQDMCTEILMQIAGSMFEDPSTGKLKIKLIRADYDPQTVPAIDPTNCVELQNLAAAGWTDVTNRIVVKFKNRVTDYKDDTAIAYSQANAVGQDGQVIQTDLDFPGVTSLALAQNIAARELQARSKPLIKCRAIVNRSFLRVLPGDVVKLTWPEANLAAIYFRVAAVNRGTLENPAIALDLVQDYFYVRRTHPPEPPIIVEIGGGISGTFGMSL